MIGQVLLQRAMFAQRGSQFLRRLQSLICTLLALQIFKGSYGKVGTEIRNITQGACMIAPSWHSVHASRHAAHDCHAQWDLNNAQARPKKKTDWKAWSEAQLDLPPREIPIPHPPSSKRAPVVPLPDIPAELSEDAQPAEQLEQSEGQQHDQAQQPTHAKQLT